MKSYGSVTAINHQGNTYQNHNEITYHTQIAIIKRQNNNKIGQNLEKLKL